MSLQCFEILLILLFPGLQILKSTKRGSALFLKITFLYNSCYIRLIVIRSFTFWSWNLADREARVSHRSKWHCVHAGELFIL